MINLRLTYTDPESGEARVIELDAQNLAGDKRNLGMVCEQMALAVDPVRFKPPTRLLKPQAAR